VGADEGAEEEAMAKLGEPQHLRCKATMKMARSLQTEEAEADEREAEDPGLVHAWPRVVVNLADS
jgi:hypothetical protein